MPKLGMGPIRRQQLVEAAIAVIHDQRVCAIIDACFGDEQFDEQVFSAWLALYGNARQSDRLRNILSVYHRRLRSSLVHELRRLVPEPEALRLAEGIGAMIDGLWLRYALTGKPNDPETPRALTRDYLAAFLERSFNPGRTRLDMAS